MANTIVKNIDLIIEGLQGLKKYLNEGVEFNPTDSKERVGTKEIAEVPKKEEIKEEILNDVKSEGNDVTYEDRKKQLDDMKYNQVKSLASDLNLSGKGKKEVIIERILEFEFETETEEVEEETPEVVEESVEEVEEQFEEEEEDIKELTLYDKVERDTADMNEEELAELLASVGKSPKGKRQALLSKLVDAIEEGLIEFDTEDEEEETEPTVEETTEIEDNLEVEEELHSIEEELDEEMTEVRRDTVKQLMLEIDEDIKTGELSKKEIKETLESINQHSEECNKCDCPDGDKVICYKKLYAGLVDDEGEVHGLSEPYEVNGENYCCGHALQELNNGNLYCEICGNEYEVE